MTWKEKICSIQFDFFEKQPFWSNLLWKYSAWLEKKYFHKLRKGNHKINERHVSFPRFISFFIHARIMNLFVAQSKRKKMCFIICRLLALRNLIAKMVQALFSFTSNHIFSKQRKISNQISKLSIFFGI